MSLKMVTVCNGNVGNKEDECHCAVFDYQVREFPNTFIVFLKPILSEKC